MVAHPLDLGIAIGPLAIDGTGGGETESGEDREANAHGECSRG